MKDTITESRIVELERVLGMVEWLWNEAIHFEHGKWGTFRGYQCPWCLNFKRKGHAPDCPRQIALGKQPPSKDEGEGVT